MTHHRVLIAGVTKIEHLGDLAEQPEGRYVRLLSDPTMVQHGPSGKLVAFTEHGRTFEYESYEVVIDEALGRIAVPIGLMPEPTPRKRRRGDG